MLEELKWFSGMRGPQETAIEQIADAFTRSDVVMLDGPTGSGKSLVAYVTWAMSGRPRALYIPTTRSLQRQVAQDFPMPVLWGRDNYPTVRRNKAFPLVHAGLCTKPGPDKDTPACHYCPYIRECPYEQAKRAALRAPLSCLNTAYFLTEANGPGRFGQQGSDKRNRDFLIFDEADQLESELMRWIEVAVSQRRLDQLGIDGPRHKTKPESWHEWINDIALPRLGEEIHGLEDSYDEKTIRYRKGLERLESSLSRVSVTEGHWVNDPGPADAARFKPVYVSDLAQRYLWRHSRKVLLMSGTFVSYSQTASDLGIDKYEVVQMPSTFPPERRPVYLRPVAKMDAKNKEYDKAAGELDKILAAHPADRILVHTVSYALTDFLQKALDNRRVRAYLSSRERDAAIEEFRMQPATVLLAPSLDRGIDLPDDACRVTVIAKIPYPYLGDKQVNARLHMKGGRVWYLTQTARTLVQMTGRGMRHEKDFCCSYILDAGYMDFERQVKNLLPEWWRRSVDKYGIVPVPS